MKHCLINYNIPVITQYITLMQASLIAVSSWCNTCMNCPSLTPSLQINQILKSKSRSSLEVERMRSSLVVRASDCQCTSSCNGPGFEPSIRRHRRIWGAADEAMLNKYENNPPQIFFFSLNLCAATNENDSYQQFIAKRDRDQAWVNMLMEAGRRGYVGMGCYWELCDCGASTVHNSLIIKSLLKNLKIGETRIDSTSEKKSFSRKYSDP